MARVPELIQHLRGAGIDKGEVLVFEAAGSEIQNSDNGLESLISALEEELIGAEGTLVVPTCTPQEGYPKPTFDPALSPSEMGPFSEFFRKKPGVIRSHSPTHSVAACGRLAVQVTAGHRTAVGRFTPWGEGPFGKGSPWDWLYEHNAWWVMLDGDWQTTPFITYVKALYIERCHGITKRMPFPEFNATGLEQELQKRRLLHSFKWGQHPVIVFRMLPAVDCALEVLLDSPAQLQPGVEFSKWLAEVEYIKENGYLQAGTARANITPATPCLRWEGKQLAGVYRDLYARVVVLSHGQQQVALVLCDLLGISREIVTKIRQKVQTETNFPAEAIQIACTHSHSTPDTVGSGYEDPEYLSFMVDTIATAICQAAAHQQPARLGWNRVPIRGLAHSRRKKMRDGRVFTTRYGVPSTWRVDPELIVGEGFLDPDLTVIRIESLDGKILAVISNFGCHASVALMSSNVSGDFPGEAMAFLEHALEEAPVVLATAGAAADVDPTLEIPYWGPRNDAMAQRVGRIFAAQVLECLERTEVNNITTLQAAQELVELEVRSDWLRLLETEQERMQQEFSTGWSMTSVMQQTLEARVIHTEVQALRLGKLILVGLPGEIFAESGLKLKRETSQGVVTVLELANDNVGYIAPAQAFAEGGYEVGQHLWGRVTPDAIEVVLAAARRLIDRLIHDDPLKVTKGADR